MKSNQKFGFFDGGKKQANSKKIIRNLIVIGDSLSDRGVFYSGERFGTQLLLLLNMLTHTPSGRFTNGLTWVDYLAINLINQFIISELLDQTRPRDLGLNREIDYLDLAINQHQPRNYAYKPEDIADDIVVKNKRIKKFINSYALNDPRQVAYRGETFVRSYCEAGLSNHNFGLFTKSIKMLVTRLIVPYLSDKVSNIKQDDDNSIQRNKQETLSIIWSGMNDIALINDPIEVPYKKKVVLSLASIKNNIKELIESGYSHFLLCNLPDVTLSPRYKAALEPNLKTLNGCIRCYNFNLRILLGKLKQLYPHCTFELYDANKQLKNIITHPELYGLDDTKIDKTYLTSSDFKPTKPGDFQHSPGYLFWDEVHPTTLVHAIIAREMEKFIRSKYLLKPPEPIQTKIIQKNFLSM